MAWGLRYSADMGLLSCVSLSWWFCICSLSLLFCSFFPCGILFHAPYSFTCLWFPVLLLYCYSWSCRLNADILLVSTSLFTWGFLFSSAVWLLWSLSHAMDGLLNFGSMPFDGLLNRSVARLGNPGLIGVDLICNKDMYISELVSWYFFQSSFDKCFCLSVAFIIIRQWNCMTYAGLLAEFLKLLWNKVCANISNYFIGQPVLWKKLSCMFSLGYLGFTTPPVS